ncbi:MAG: acyl--CoA ligase [Chloroflexota bacterium]|nr:acyl--CoA ligase [Chloroflexota bacterium]
MGKGAVGLVAGYWPDDVFRHLAIPGLSLDDCLLARPLRRFPDHRALLVGYSKLSYRELAAEVERWATALAGALTEGERRVALVSADPLQLATVFLAAMKRRCALFLADADRPINELIKQIEVFGANLVVAGSGMNPDFLARPNVPWRTITVRDLARSEPGRPSPPARVDLKAPAVALAGPRGRLVHHSHASLVAWAISWSAFLPVTERHVFCSLEPLFSWGGLLALLAALSRGATCSFLGAGSAKDRLLQLREQTPDYAILSFDQARALAQGGNSVGQTLDGRLGAAFVTVDAPFAVGERRRIETAFDVPLLTLFGNAVSGPAVSAHPSWYLDESVGIPVTNVDLWPLHPQTGEPLAVPWEAIDYAELGVRSPMLAPEHQTPEERAEWVKDGWLRTHLTALMDPSGLFYFRPWR